MAKRKEAAPKKEHKGGAPKGNQFALGNNGGRPLETLERFPKTWKEDLINLYKQGATNTEIRIYLGQKGKLISYDLLNRLKRDCPEFSSVITKGEILRKGKKKKDKTPEHLALIAKRRLKPYYTRPYSELALKDKIALSMRSAVNYHIKNRGLKKDFKTFDKLGYTKEQLLNHLAARFEKGMTFDNYGKWHIDHIIPVSWFDLTDDYQFKQCWRSENLAPKWAFDNLSKSNRYAENPQLSMLI